MLSKTCGKVLAFCFCMALPLFSAEPLPPEPFAASPQILIERSAGFNPASKDGEVVLLHEERYQFDNQGRAHGVDWTIFRQTSSETDTSAEIETVWSPWREERPVLRARVISPDGSVHQFDPKTIEVSGLTGPDQRTYSDRQLLRGPLPAITNGGLIETVIETQETNPMFGAGMVRQFYLTGRNPRQIARLILDYPEELPLHYVVRLAPGLQPRKTVTGHRVTLVFETGPTEPAEAAPANLASDTPFWPYIAFSSGESWSQVARQFGKTIDAQIAVQDVHELLPSLPQGSRTEQMASALLARLHEKVHYTGVEFGEASWVPRTPNETFQRGFGDCKDKAAALIAMLRAAGLPAKMALLRSKPGFEIDPDVPGLGSFNHAIVYIPGKPDLWIDATAVWLPAGQLPLADQGRYALIIGDPTPGLIRTPVSDATANLQVETREFFLPALGKARIIETTMFSGGIEEAMRDHYGEADEKSVREHFESYGEKVYLSTKLAGVKRESAKDLARPFTLRAEYLEAGRAATHQSLAVVGIRREQLFNMLPAWLQTAPDSKAKPRTEDVELFTPFTVEWKYKVHLPEGFEVRELPPAETRKLGLATYFHHFEMDKSGDLTGLVHFDTGPARMSADQARALNDGVVEIHDKALLLYFDESGEKLLAAGKIREALAVFNKLIAGEPQEAIHHTRLARALLAAGAGEQARKEAGAAVVLAPQLATAHQTLGWTLEHDLAGRRFEKGFDLNGAIASYRKAAELDPDNWQIRGDYAILLEHNAAGERYGKGADMAQAIAEYRAVLKHPEGAGMLDNLLIACLRAGRKDVLKEYLPESMASDEARWPVDLAVRSIVQGPAAAVDRANSSISDEQRRVAALANAALILMKCRDYPDMVALYTAAGHSAGSASQFLPLAERFAKLRRWEDIEVPPDLPQSAVMQLFRLMASPADNSELLSILSLHITEHLGPSQKTKGLQEFRQARRSLASEAGFSADEMVDIVLTFAESEVDGDEQSGYRIRWGFGSTPMTVFVAKEDGRYRILEMLTGSASSGATSGYELLARLQQNRPAAARTLLDWLREEIKPEGGDDPLAGHLLPRFWQKGQTGSEADIRRAAAALLAEDEETAADAIPILTAELKSAGDPALREKLQLALAVAQHSASLYKELLETTAALAADQPASDRLFCMTAKALMKLGRWPEFDKLTEERLKQNPRDAAALEARLQAAVIRVDLESGRRQEDLLRKTAKLDQDDYNHLLWLALEAGKVDQRALDTLQEALLHASSKPSANLLHTVASVYAETGNSAEARQFVLKYLTGKGLEEPDAAAWYIFGRIAENYGLVSVAKGMYAKVTKSDDGKDPGSSYTLAQRRLAKL